MITTWVPGTPADVAPLATAVAADRLADALKALHGVAPPSAPATQRPTLERLSQPFEQKLDSVGEADAVTLRRVWRTALAADAW
jgi:aminoglycoside phosphotransferase (APT) family kinase protein